MILLSKNLELKSIGLLKERFPLSRIKVNADHAGLSALLLFLSLMLFSKDKLLTSLNNNLLIVPRSTEMLVATVDSTTRVWLMSRITVSLTKPHILTPLKLETAELMVVHSRSTEFRLLRAALESKLLLTQDPLVFLLMPQTGATTQAEFSTTAEETLTTTSPWLATPTHTGKSRTHGELHGESKDTSDSPPAIPVVSVKTLHLGLTDPITLF